MSREVNTINPIQAHHAADLLTRIGIALTLRQRSSLRKIHIVIAEGCVTLRGQLPSYFDKQLAIETTRRVAGVYLVKDEITVIDFDSEVGSFLPAEKRHSTGDDDDGAGTTNNLQEREFTMQRPNVTSIVATVTFVRAAGVALLLWASLLTGCSSDDRLKVYPVEGQITFNGQPLANALVVLHPKDTSNPKLFAARAQTDQAGVFKVTTYDSNDGAPAGAYAVTVEYYQLIDKGNGGFEPGPNVLPTRLASPQSTDVVVEIAANPNKLPPLEVSR